MFIRSIEYSQWENGPREWNLEGCTFGNINLIVGKNATGKTRILNIIGNLGNMFAGQRKAFSSADYKLVEFEDASNRVKFSLNCERGKIVGESLSINDNNKLNRWAEGIGEIYYEKEGKALDFQSPENEIASFARRDSIQHPFLDVLFNWGKSIRHYYFGKPLGQDRLAVFIKTGDKNRPKDVDLKQTEDIVPIFRKAKEQYGGDFVSKVITDMGKIGYDLETVDEAPMKDVTVAGPMVSGEVFGIIVKERDLESTTDQHEMSQGMFRALSLISQITYSELIGEPLCILIDDIGEGLDYERSTALIKMLIERTKGTSNQLIMATNDRFVMNGVPLEYWSIIHRIGGLSKVFNYRNAKKVFDEFSITGLSNFDLFSSQSFLKEFGKN